jgi:hypothetical protein
VKKNECKGSTGKREQRKKRGKKDDVAKIAKKVVYLHIINLENQKLITEP